MWDLFTGPTLVSDRELISTDFLSYVHGAFKGNGPIFSCIAARQMVFSEARFRWRRFEGGRPTELFGNQSLRILERPWRNGTTGELLARMEQDASLAGNAYFTIRGGEIKRLRPDWVTIVVGVPGEEDLPPSERSSPFDLRARILAYVYNPTGLQVPNLLGPQVSDVTEGEILFPEEVCHYSPIPDPEFNFVGMSWLTPVAREIEADSQSTIHKKKFLENAAVPNMAVKFSPETSKDDFNKFVEKFNATHKGALNAYQPLFLYGGIDVTPLTHDFKQLEFTQSIGKGESRIAAAAGVPSSWVGFSEGLQGSALNAGNFSAARRRFADGTIRPLWRMAAASLETLVRPPEGAHLWYDTSDIAFLREDETDRAEILRTQLSALNQGIMSGYEPDASVDAVMNFDLARLRGKHTNNVSVQMRPPVDAEDNKAGFAAEILAKHADAISKLASSDKYDFDSIVDAVTSGDLSRLRVKAGTDDASPVDDAE
ncbi:phage portal protein [Longimycelium tulufanense]|uniref:phage portal protein n=1 Tax=Longimycelium tulufanense TaxID=907463 RepID=UPI0016670965|nr:phage portal protein [Longimycelium tulufanense]